MWYNNKAETGRLAWRKAIEYQLLPALRAFNPDLIIISAGFDGTKYDIGNLRHSDNAIGIDLTPLDYEWVTSKIMDIANMCCNGKIISILEGGYGHYKSKQDLLYNNTNTEHFTRSKVDHKKENDDLTDQYFLNKEKKQQEDDNSVVIDTDILVNSCYSHVKYLIHYPKK